MTVAHSRHFRPRRAPRRADGRARIKKGRSAMNERPKSREETPKEGSGTAWRAIPHCNICHCAAQSARFYWGF